MFICMSDDKSAGGESKHRDVPTQLLTIERCLVMHDIRYQVFSRARSLEGIGDEVWVIPGTLDIGAQLQG